MSTPLTRATITLDQESMLADAVTRLTTQFAGVFNAATVKRLLHDSYTQIAETAATYLPSMR